MARVKDFSKKAKAQIAKLSQAFLRRQLKASTSLTSTMASNEEAHESSLEYSKHAKFQPTADCEMQSGESRNADTSGFGGDRTQYRQLPSFGSLSGIMISSSSQFNMQDLADTSVAMLETDPHPTSSSTTTFDMEDSADACSEIYPEHDISSATDFDSEDTADTCTSACETDSHLETEDHTNKQKPPKIRIPTVERSEICFSPLSSTSRNSFSIGNDDTTVDEDKDSRYYGVCRPFDFSNALAIQEDSNYRGDGDDDEAEFELDEELVKAWRARHGYT